MLSGIYVLGNIFWGVSILLSFFEPKSPFKRKHEKLRFSEYTPGILDHFQVLLLMEEILHHQGCIKPCN